VLTLDAFIAGHSVPRLFTGFAISDPELLSKILTEIIDTTNHRFIFARVGPNFQDFHDMKISLS
jgi:hypothetical protein